MNKPLQKTVLALVLALGLLLAGYPALAAATYEPIAVEMVTDDAKGYGYAPEDTDAAWDAATATPIVLNGSSISAGGAVVVSGSTATITAGGTYVLSGVLDDGQIIVDAGEEALVRLVLNGVSLNSGTSAPIYAKSAAKTVLILAEGTDNTVVDAPVYVYGENGGEEEEPNAAIFSAGPLSITGSGGLYVTGNFNDGIGTNGVLVITGGSIAVTSADDGLSAGEGMAILDGTFVINAAGDGYKAEPGYVVLDGGSHMITAAKDGVQAETNLIVTGGQYSILAGGGWSAGLTDDSDSMKGLKAGAILLINNGDFIIDAADSAIKSDGDVVVNGGTYTLATGDDGLHADFAMTINGGDILILTSVEGIEGAWIDVGGGTVRLSATDDGMNAAADDGVTGLYMRFTGGDVYVSAGGDGLDSNGDMFFDGGKVVVDGPEGNEDGALDADGDMAMNGGTLIAVGSLGMAQYPSSSNQGMFVIGYTEVQQAGAVLYLRDAAGDIVVEHMPAKSYQSAVISAPGLTVGQTYSLYADDTLLGELELSSTITLVSSDGSEYRGGGQGPGGGGMPPFDPGEGGERPEPPEGEPPVEQA